MYFDCCERILSNSDEQIPKVEGILQQIPCLELIKG